MPPLSPCETLRWFLWGPQAHADLAQNVLLISELNVVRQDGSSPPKAVHDQGQAKIVIIVERMRVERMRGAIVDS